jgi:hypothetical protein
LWHHNTLFGLVCQDLTRPDNVQSGKFDQNSSSKGGL